MKLWTIQTSDVWTTLRSEGIWRAREAFVAEHWLSSYRWIVYQMEARMASREVDDQMPVWIWRQWGGARRLMPDLRSRAHLPPSTSGVRLELEVPADRVLLSDFDLWHYVLNYWYLPSSVRDGRHFDAELKAAGLCYYETKPLPDMEYHARIERSWERIFDLAWVNRTFTTKRTEKKIQGVVWELRLADIRSVKEFIAR